MFELIKRHPWLSTGVGIVLLLVIYYVFFSGGGSQQPILSQPAPDNSLQIATLQQNTALAQSNNALTAAQGQIDAYKTVSLAQIAATQGIDEKTIAATLAAHLNDNSTSINADTINTTSQQNIALGVANYNYLTNVNAQATSVSLANTAASVAANNNATNLQVANLAYSAQLQALNNANEIENASLNVIANHPGTAINIGTGTGDTLTGLSASPAPVTYAPTPGQTSTYTAGASCPFGFYSAAYGACIGGYASGPSYTGPLTVTQTRPNFGAGAQAWNTVPGYNLSSSLGPIGAL